MANNIGPMIYNMAAPFQAGAKKKGKNIHDDDNVFYNNG